MRAMVLHGPGALAELPLREQDVAVPQPGPGEVGIEISACGVCRTDLQLVQGDLGLRRRPLIPGHQIVGHVCAVGAGVDQQLVGTRVGVAWNAGTCGTCRQCRHDRENLCQHGTFTGWDRDGGYASYTVADAAFTYPLPAAFDDLAAAPLLCGGVIGYRSLRVAEVQPGSRLGLFGFGASATQVIQIATSWGCDVFVCTRSSGEQARAEALGAIWAGGYDDTLPAPLDAAITFAPSGDVVVAALRAVDRGGIVAINAIHLDRIPQFPYELLWWERQLRSVANVTRRDALEFLDLAASIPLRTVTEPFPLEQANEALRRLDQGHISGAAVLVVDPAQAPGSR